MNRIVIIPENIADCNKILDQFLTDTEKAQIKSQSKEEFIINSHFGLGQWLRNNWKLWENNSLTTELKSLGIIHSDDMSGAILKLYYDYLIVK